MSLVDAIKIACPYPDLLKILDDMEEGRCDVWTAALRREPFAWTHRAEWRPRPAPSAARPDAPAHVETAIRLQRAEIQAENRVRCGDVWEWSLRCMAYGNMEGWARWQGFLREAFGPRGEEFIADQERAHSAAQDPGGRPCPTTCRRCLVNREYARRVTVAPPAVAGAPAPPTVEEPRPRSPDARQRAANDVEVPF